MRKFTPEICLEVIKDEGVSYKPDTLLIKEYRNLQNGIENFIIYKEHI